MREYERRRSTREQRVREKHPHLGGLLLAVGDAPAHEAAWARGAAGEERVAAALTRYLRDGIVLMHDRRIPRSRANIDHIAIAPSGVWVVDAKRYKGKVMVRRPLFGAASLVIGGRDRTKLVEALAGQVAVVARAVADLAPDVPVHGALCFVDSELPLLGTLAIDGHVIARPKALAKRINADGPLPSALVRDLAAQLVSALPRA